MTLHRHAWIVGGAVAIGIAGWIGGAQWRTAGTPDAAPARRTAVTTTDPACILPPIAAPGANPRQSDVPAQLQEIALPAGHATPRAGFSVEARVLARRAYTGDRQARFSPIDIALGWGPMADPAVRAKLDIAQSSRWYHYGWLGTPPIAPPVIADHSANMHMVPASPELATSLANLQPGQRVRIDGWLVDLHDRVGWNWNTSMTRDDRGEGACEIVYACRVVVIPE